jgi:hypothetical protein
LPTPRTPPDASSSRSRLSVLAWFNPAALAILPVECSPRGSSRSAFFTRSSCSGGRRSRAGGDGLAAGDEGSLEDEEVPVVDADVPVAEGDVAVADGEGSAAGTGTRTSLTGGAFP